MANNNPLSFVNNNVAVYDQQFNQLFSASQAIKAVVKEESKVMEHPVETGIIIVDHRVILPIEITLSLILTAATYQDVYKSIRQYYLNGTLLIVQTKSDIYQNQIIQSIPHEEDPSQFNILTLELNLKQVLFVQAQYTKTKNNANSSTANRGVQQGSAASGQQTKSALVAFGAPGA